MLPPIISTRSLFVVYVPSGFQMTVHSIHFFLDIHIFVYIFSEYYPKKQSHFKSKMENVHWISLLLWHGYCHLFINIRFTSNLYVYLCSIVPLFETKYNIHSVRIHRKRVYTKCFLPAIWNILVRVHATPLEYQNKSNWILNCSCSNTKTVEAYQN